MKIINIQDRYNPAKVWIVKKSKAGHYFVNQSINGQVFYSKYTRQSGKHLASVLQIPFSAFTEMFNYTYDMLNAHQDIAETKHYKMIYGYGCIICILFNETKESN